LGDGAVEGDEFLGRRVSSKDTPTITHVWVDKGYTAADAAKARVSFDVVSDPGLFDTL
jgi:hypothetical protein